MSKQEQHFDNDEEQDLTQDCIKEMIEYQENQFNPGYYIGTGRIPPYVKASGNALPIAIWMFIQATG